MVVDDDSGVELECDDEETGTGERVGAETDEGDSVLADQSTGSCDKPVSQSYRSVNPKPSVVRGID